MAREGTAEHHFRFTARTELAVAQGEEHDLFGAPRGEDALPYVSTGMCAVRLEPLLERLAVRDAGRREDIQGRGVEFLPAEPRGDGRCAVEQVVHQEDGLALPHERGGAELLAGEGSSAEESDNTRERCSHAQEEAAHGDVNLGSERRERSRASSVAG